MIYAGDNGGCMGCDSLGYELAERGHRRGCRSEYANEPARPPAWRAAKRRQEAKALEEKAAKLIAEAEEIEKGLLPT